jgi:hypothetical protein
MRRAVIVCFLVGPVCKERGGHRGLPSANPRCPLANSILVKESSHRDGNMILTCGLR